MMLSPTLKLTMDELSGDHIVIEDLAHGSARWVIGMEDVPKVMRLLSDTLVERGAGIQSGKVTIPIDCFVLLASALGYYLGLTWREADAGIKRPSIPEFAHFAGIPLLRPLIAEGGTGRN